MFAKMWAKIKEVLSKVGLISSIESIPDHPKVIVDDSFYTKIQLWESAYQGAPDWQKYDWRGLDGAPHYKRQLSLNMPKILAKKMASLVFNQEANILVTEAVVTRDETSPEDAENPANEFIQGVLNDNYFYHNMERYLEYMFGTGGMVMRLYVADGQVKIRFATADSFYPISQDENGVSECVIASKFVKSSKHYTLLEWHIEDDNNYIIQNELYESLSDQGDDLGTKVPLSIIYGDKLKPQSLYPKTNYSRPTFIYLKPNIANNFDLDSPLGIPLYANAIDTLRQLDQAYDMLMQEMYMGRRRIVAPMSMLAGVPDPRTGKHKFFVDFNDPVYQPFNYNPTGTSSEEPRPTDITLALRNQTFLDTINSLLDILAAQTGFSAGTFSYSSTQGLQTATEVISQNSDTYQSKNSHETIIANAIEQMCTTILELGKAASIYTGPTDIDVSVNFDDSIAKDRTENAQYYELANGNKPLMPHRESIKRANNLTDKEADDWLNQIKTDEPQVSDVEDLMTDAKDKQAGDEDAT